MNEEALIQLDVPPGVSVNRMVQIYAEPFARIIEYTKFSHVAGDIAEFGTYRGFTASIIAQNLRQYGDKRTLWLFDSWEGFPEMVGNDVNCKEVIEGYWKKGDCAPSENTLENIKKHMEEVIPGQTKFIKGFYNETLVDSNNLPAAISFLHIDCDLYESTRTVFEKVVLLLSDGAVIAFDDFNNNLANNNFGERKAYKEFLAANCEPWISYGWSGYSFIYHGN